MEMKLETVTPEKAAEWLKKNTSNRTLSMRIVNKIAAAIDGGEWRVNGDSIRFAGDVLVDGQHRLHAIMKSGIPVKTYVIRGLAEDVYDTIDQGRARSLGDILSRNGEKNYKHLASAIRWLVAIRSGITANQVVAFTSNAKLHEIADGLDGLRESVTFIRSEDIEKVGPSGVLAALHFLFAEKDKELADTFFRRVGVGEGLSKHMNEFKLRNVLIERKTSNKKLGLEPVCTLIIKTWNAIRANKVIGCLKVQPDEKRPEII